MFSKSEIYVSREKMPLFIEALYVSIRYFYINYFIIVQKWLNTKLYAFRILISSISLKFNGTLPRSLLELVFISYMYVQILRISQSELIEMNYTLNVDLKYTRQIMETQNIVQHYIEY